MSVPGPLKYHGGKHYLARRLAAMMPPHTHYVEPYAGGLSVMLARDPEGVSEVANDLHQGLSNFWRVLQDPAHFGEFSRRCQATPFSSLEWDRAGLLDAADAGGDPVGRAWAFFVRCRMSLAGRMASFAPLSKSRTRRGMNEQAAAWLTAVDGLPAVHERLRRVAILSRPALEVVRSEDGPGTFFYCDPPYLRETRAAGDVYAHEMSQDDHKALLQALWRLKGKVMLSGYPSRLYDTELVGWSRREFLVANHAAGGKSKRRMKEVVWANYTLPLPPGAVGD